MLVNEIGVEIPVTFLKEGGVYVAYSPALDLTTQGETLQDAKRMFSEAAQLFIEGCIEMKTLEDVLKDLGWEKVQGQWHPPAYEQTSERILIPA